MKFSCILPVYNTEHALLEKCIKSILNQSFQDFEIIIVDDGSQEQIAELCDQYCTEDSRIKAVHQKNMGLPGARNSGIKHAKGDWLVHIDSDDWIGDGLLESINRVLPCEDVDILFWGYTASNGSWEKSFGLKNPNILTNNFYSIKTQVLRANLEGGHGFDSVALNTTWGKAYRRNFVLDNRLYFDLELKRAQDVIYNLYAYSVARGIKYVNTVAHYYRLDNDSLSRGYNDKTKDRLIKTANAAITFLKQNPQYKEIEPSILAFCRRCFNIIVNMDFINPDNPKQFKLREREFQTTLSQFPFNKAFARNNLPKINGLNSIVYRIIAMGSLWKLYVILKIRTFIRVKILQKLG